MIAQNRKAKFEYFLGDTLEAGIVLVGTEVKAIRAGRISLNEAYIAVKDDGLYMVGCHIGEYNNGGRVQHLPRRERKLLLKKREINRLIGAVQAKGVTLVPTKLYEKNGHFKLEVSVAEGKKKLDKRQTIKDRDWKRVQARIMKGA